MDVPLVFVPLRPWASRSAPTPKADSEDLGRTHSSAPAHSKIWSTGVDRVDAAVPSSLGVGTTRPVEGIEQPSRLNGTRVLPARPSRQTNVALVFAGVGLCYRGEASDGIMSGQGTMFKNGRALFSGTFLTSSSWQAGHRSMLCQVYEPGGARLHQFQLRPSDDPECPWVPDWQTLRSQGSMPSDRI